MHFYFINLATLCPNINLESKANSLQDYRFVGMEAKKIRRLSNLMSKLKMHAPQSQSVAASSLQHLQCKKEAGF